MAAKHKLTNSEIIEDIKRALKQPKDMSKDSYKKWTVIAIIIAVSFSVVAYWIPEFIFKLILLIILFVIAGALFSHFKLKRKINALTLDDYSITTEVVHSAYDEHYVADRGKYRRGEQIDNYDVRFENGKTWRIPEENYAWNEKLRLLDFRVYESIHRGDEMIVVTKKDTGDIVTAYHTAIFEYKHSREE